MRDFLAGFFQCYNRRSGYLILFGLVVLSLSNLFFFAGCLSPEKRSATKSLEPVATEEYRTSILDFIGSSLQSTIRTVGDRFPEATENGVWNVNSGGWTGGYFAGMLWMMFEATGDSAWLAPAGRYTRLLEHLKTDVNNIDVGILFYPSFAKGYRLTGNEY